MAFKTVRAYIFLFIIVCTNSAIAIANEVIGDLVIYKVQKGEDLYTIARKFDVGVEELIYANKKIDFSQLAPKEGSSLIIPLMHIVPLKSHNGIVVNKAELRMYFFDKDSIKTFPVSLGALGRQTPIGLTKITYKQFDPAWIVPRSILLEDPKLPAVVPPGLDNPLGRYAIFLEWPSMMIHSTNEPNSIGTYSSHGCVRLYPEDAKFIFNEAKPKMSVKVIDEAILTGQRNGSIYLLATPSEEQKAQIDLFGYVKNNPNIADIKAKIINKYGKNKIDEAKLDKALKEYKTIPVIINKNF